MAERLCTCPPRERVPYRDNTCFRCGGELVPPMLPVDESLAPVIDLHADHPQATGRTPEEVSEASRAAIALLTALIDDDRDTAADIVEGFDDPTGLAFMAGCYGAAAWSFCRSLGADTSLILQQLALAEARSS